MVRTLSVYDNQPAAMVITRFLADQQDMVTKQNSKSTPTDCLFQEPWWLDAVAPGAWSVAQVEANGQLVARMPYLVKKRFGLTIVTMPPLTQTLGPWLRSSEAKYCVRLGREKDLIEELVDQLPRAAVYSFACHHAISNVLPFFWKGFSLHLCYSYRLNDLTSLESIASGLRQNIRTDLRKSERTVEIRDDLGIDDFLHVNRMVFRKQGLRPPYADEFLIRFHNALPEKQRKILFAVDSQDRIHAVAYLVWDERSTYYLMGGRNPDVPNSGATAAVVWAAIKHAAEVSSSFDFEGSMIEPVERFFRAFGAVQTPYVRLLKASPTIKAAMTLRGMA